MLKQKEIKATEELKQLVIATYIGESLARQKRLPKLEKLLKELDPKETYKFSKGDQILLQMAKDKGVDVVV